MNKTDDEINRAAKATKALRTAFVTLGAACVVASAVMNNNAFAAPYDDNPKRAKGARKFKRNKHRSKITDKSKRTNRRKQ